MTTRGMMEPGNTLEVIRKFLLLLFLLGLAGTGAELLLVGHTEEFWQSLPLFLMFVSLIALGWGLATRGPGCLRAFQAIMILFVISGFVGLGLHYQAHVEFELEMYPALEGWELFAKAIEGTSPPILAPGMMIHLGLLGLAYAYLHTDFSRSME